MVANNQDNELLAKVADMSGAGAINIRKNGKLIERKITDDITISNKEDGKGIDIFIKENAKDALVLIPVIITESGLSDVVYNDFHVGKNATVKIIAGCAVQNPGDLESSHQGIHRFFVGENAKVTYIEAHYGTGKGAGHKRLDPITEIILESGASMDIDTVQIEGVDSTERKTNALLKSGSTLAVSEKIKTTKAQSAITDFSIMLEGEGSSAHVVSRSVAEGESYQEFRSNVIGKAGCYGHVECDAILKDKGRVKAIPEVDACHVDANLIHEATIGKIAGDQLTKLMSLGLSSEEAEAEIIKGFLK